VVRELQILREMIHCNVIYFLYTVLLTMWLLADDTNQGETSVNLALSNFVADVTLDTMCLQSGRLEFETPDLDAPRQRRTKSTG
jgi:hypothetical protein